MKPFFVLWVRGSGAERTLLLPSLLNIMENRDKQCYNKILNDNFTIYALGKGCEK